MLHGTVPHCTALYRNVSHYTALHRTVPHCTSLYRTVPQVLSRIEPELSGFHPDLDDALMYHLLRLPSLETLDMQAGFAF